MLLVITILSEVTPATYTNNANIWMHMVKIATKKMASITGMVIIRSIYIVCMWSDRLVVPLSAM